MRKIIGLFLLIISIGTFFLAWTGIVDASTDITSSDFEISVGSFTPGSTSLIDEDDAGWTVQNVLMTILEKLILVFWVFAIFIMTIGAWYMIIYHGQDEFLSKWKSIFMSWIIALVVALWAGIIVRLFALLLY